VFGNMERKASVIRRRGYVFIGDVVNGVKDGKGSQFFSTKKEVYEGHWKNNEPNGRGVWQKANGDVYEGEFKDGKAEGRGVYRFADGHVYEGEYKDGQRNGRGTLHFAKGNLYEGEFKNNKMDGRGVYRYSNGSVYEGEFKNNKFKRGDISRKANSDANVCEGELRDGNSNGSGISLLEWSCLLGRVGKRRGYADV